MHKTYIIVLSSLIACSSRGMEHVTEDASSKVPLLVSIAAKGVTKHIDRQVQEDAKILKDNKQLTPENVRKNILNEVALLELRKESEDEILHQYQNVYKERNDALRTQFLSHAGWIERVAINDTGDHIAVLTSFSNYRYNLRVWREDADGWYSRGAIRKYFHPGATVSWESDDQLLVAVKTSVAKTSVEVLQKNDQGDFKTLHAIALDGDREIARVAWNSDRKVLAILDKFDLRIDLHQVLDDGVRHVQNLNFIEDEDASWREYKVPMVWGPDGRLYVHSYNVVQAIERIHQWHYSNERGLYEKGETFSVEGFAGAYLQEIVDCYKEHNLPVEQYLKLRGIAGGKTLSISDDKKDVEVKTPLPQLYAIAQHIFSTTKKNHRENQGGNATKKLKRDNHYE